MKQNKERSPSDGSASSPFQGFSTAIHPLIVKALFGEINFKIVLFVPDLVKYIRPSQSMLLEGY